MFVEINFQIQGQHTYLVDVKSFVFILVCVAYKMQRRVAGVSEFKFEELSHGKSLHVTLAVPGWVTNQDPG